MQSETNDIKKIKKDTEEIKQIKKDTESIKEIKKDTKNIQKIKKDVESIKTEIKKEIDSVKKTILENPYDFMKDKASDFNKRVRDRTGTAIVAAFAFIIALVWRDVIQEIIKKTIVHFGISGSTYIYQILLASITTIICVLGIMYFSKWSEKENK